MDERTAHRAFRSLLLATAYPGRPQRGPSGEAGATLAALQEAVWCDAPRPPVLLGTDDASAVVAAADRGTELEPELGATLVRVVEAGRARLPVVLRGPGVDGRLETTLPLTSAELAARDEACRTRPLGVDLFFVEADGSIGALPRSTRVERRDG